MKSKQILSIDEETSIVIRSHANLDIQAKPEWEIGIETDINAQKIRKEGKTLRLIFVEDCELSVPENSKLIIEKVGSNARVRGMQHKLQIIKVNGDLALQKNARVEIIKVDRDCLIEDQKDDLSIEKVSGDLKGIGFAGSVKVERVGGDAELSRVSKGLKMRANGDITLGLLENTEEEIYLRAGDDIKLSLPPEPNVEFNIRSRSEKIVVDLPGRSDTFRSKNSKFMLGEGLQKIELDAYGKVKIDAQEFDNAEVMNLFAELDNLWAQLKSESTARRAARAETVHFAEGIEVDAEQMAHDAFESIEDLTRNAVFNSIQQAEVRVKDALKRVELQIRDLGFDDIPNPPEAPKPPQRKKEEFSEDRLVIMRMLQEGKISVEEADQLLEALDYPEE